MLLCGLTSLTKEGQNQNAGTAASERGAELKTAGAKTGLLADHNGNEGANSSNQLATTVLFFPTKGNRSHNMENVDPGDKPPSNGE